MDSETESDTSVVTVPDQVYFLDPAPVNAHLSRLTICGEAVFGRGDSSGIHDKRLSRRHVSFSVASPSNALTLRPLGAHVPTVHRNGAPVPTSRETSTTLHPGDVVAFVPPDMFAFVVVAAPTEFAEPAPSSMHEAPVVVSTAIDEYISAIIGPSSTSADGVSGDARTAAPGATSVLPSDGAGAPDHPPHVATANGAAQAPKAALGSAPPTSAAAAPAGRALSPVLRDPSTSSPVLPAQGFSSSASALSSTVAGALPASSPTAGALTASGVPAAGPSPGLPAASPTGSADPRIAFLTSLPVVMRGGPVALLTSPTADALAVMTLPELRAKLKAEGMPASGKRAELVARLSGAYRELDALRAAHVDTPADPPRRSAEFWCVEVPRETEAFWALEEKVRSWTQGRNDDYVKARILAKKKPVTFVLKAARKVFNPVLEARFQAMKAQLDARVARGERSALEARERVSFHGTHPRHVGSILTTSLLRYMHPLNPSRSQSDDGWFGTNRKGVYVSRYVDYTLKYGNNGAPLDVGESADSILFRTLPGRTKLIKSTGAIDPSPGYDSHSSPSYLEWYLFDEDQLCPDYVVTMQATADTRTAADDGEEEEEEDEEEDEEPPKKG
eukprot:TRINITY_DN2183_c0_g1_i1.p1 TRINITY_DN2183_c0_g1~~TRINITY_DN2183_c0_g1_i1.p1  ORF type:complete len:617 (-),score=107.46 TRINITY_DN2183_c0_g1_i1:110-1960(-)